jgi:hypothetical protein
MGTCTVLTMNGSYLDEQIRFEVPDPAFESWNLKVYGGSVTGTRLYI